MTTMPLPSSDATPPAPGGPNRLLIGVAIAGGVLVLVLVAIVFLLIGRGSATPRAVGSPDPSPATSGSATPTPSVPPTPAAEETQAPPAPPPVDTSTRFTSLSADLTVECDPTGEQDKPEITFSWTAVNAAEAWYSPSDEDAKDDGYLRFPSATAGDNGDLTDEHLFPCNHRQFMDVTITLVGSNGRHVSEHLVYEDVNWNSGGEDE